MNAELFRIGTTRIWPTIWGKDPSPRLLAESQEVHTSARTLRRSFLDEQVRKRQVVSFFSSFDNFQRPGFRRNFPHEAHVPEWPAKDRLLQIKIRTNTELAAVAQTYHQAP